MRCELAIVLAACGYTDVEQPIGLVPHGLPDDWVANLEEAGACWNLEFDTHYVTGGAALHADQQVDVAFDDATCLQAPAQVQPGWPTTLGICPQRYWQGLGGPYDSRAITPFRVLSHELGHVLNMVGHPDDPQAVMRSGDEDFTPMFHAVDRQRFIAANGDHAIESPCTRVIRSYRPGSDGTVSHCACETGELDVTRPIALVVAPQLGNEILEPLANAAQCWNLHYGLQLEVGASQPGETIAHLDRCNDVAGRALDGDSVYACGYDVANIDDQLYSIGDVLAVDWANGVTSVFSTGMDQLMAARYGIGTACKNVQLDDSTQQCSCAD